MGREAGYAGLLGTPLQGCATLATSSTPSSWSGAAVSGCISATVVASAVGSPCHGGRGRAASPPSPGGRVSRNTLFLVKYLHHGGHGAEQVPLRPPARAPRRRLLGDEEGARRLSVHSRVHSYDCGVPRRPAYAASHPIQYSGCDELSTGWGARRRTRAFSGRRCRVVPRSRRPRR